MTAKPQSTTDETLEPCPWCKALPEQTDLAPSQHYRITHGPTCFLIGRLADPQGRERRAHYIPLREVSVWNSARIPASAAPVVESPILAFQAWLERWVVDNGRKLTQDEYGIAYAAFITAHPGEGPKAQVMAAPVVDNAPSPCAMCDTGLVFTEQELTALTELYERTGLRTAQIIKQALRVYQLHIHGKPHSSAAPMKDESGWLLEKMHNGNVHYIAANYVLQWTDDPNKALRLARREDAEALCTIVEDCEKIAEHGWPAAATAAPQVSNDLLRDVGAIIIVNEGSAGARVEIRFAELQDAQRLHQALAQMRVAAPVDHDSIPLNSYERILTIEWDKYNARRHELIKAERSRVLSEAEVLELFELQWLARIKHGVSSGPRVTQKQPLPDRFLCINPEEQPTVINFLRGYGTDAERELARLHLNLCLRCQELANAAPVEQSDSSIPTCPDCQQGYICEHCDKSIIDYYSGNEGAR